LEGIDKGLRYTTAMIPVQGIPKLKGRNLCGFNLISGEYEWCLETRNPIYLVIVVRAIFMDKYSSKWNSCFVFPYGL